MSPLDAPVALVLIGLAFLACCLILNHAVRHASDIEPESSGWDRLDGVGDTCYLRCSLPGTIHRRERADLGGQWVAVCPGHSDAGDRLGWWADRDLTYSEQRALHDDRRRITGEAAGGGL